MDIIDLIDNYFNGASPWNCFNKILVHMLNISGASIGIVGIIKYDKDLILYPYGISNIAWNSSMSSSLPYLTFRLNKTNLLSSPVTNKTVVVTNTPNIHSDYKGTPKGHIKLKNYLGVPIIHKDEVVGLIALANRDSDFTDDVVKAVTECSKKLTSLFLLYKNEEINDSYIDIDNICKTAINMMDQGILIVDRFDKIKFTNLQFKKMFRFEDINILDKKISGIIPYFYDAFSNFKKTKIESGSRIVFNIDSVDKVFYVDMRYAVERGTDYYYIMFTDTEKYQTMINNELDKKDKYIHFINHEIRNSLQTILLSTFLLLNKAEDLDSMTIEKNVRSIDRSSKMIKKILDDIKNINDITEGDIDIHKTDVNFASVLSDIVESLTNILQSKKIKIKYSISEFRMYTDEVWLTKIIKCIVINSIRHTESGYIGIDFTKTDRYIINIQDNGIGYTGTEINNVMNDHYDIKGTSDTVTDPSFGTFQTNLIMAKKLTEKLGGTITIKSSYDKGTLYTIKFPIETYKEETDTDLGDILIVDDNQENCDLLKDYLSEICKEENFRYKTINCVYNGYDCLSHYEECEADTIFLDINMIGLDGYEVAKILREKRFPGKLIAISGNIYINSPSKTSQDKMDLFDASINKPIMRDEIIKTLRDLKDRV